MKVEHINAFIIAVSEVFETTIGTKPHKSNLNVKTGYAPSNDVSAVIGLSGNTYGSVVLSFPRETALKVLSKMPDGEDSRGVSDDRVADAVCELANTIAERAKTKLTEMNIKTYISIARVVLGTGHYISRPKEVPCVEIEFDSEAGPFTLGVAFKVLQDSFIPS